MRKASKRINKKEEITKDVCQKYHCLKRIRQRLNIKFTEEDYEQIVSCIKHSNKLHDRFKLKHIGNQSIRLSIYELIVDNLEPVHVIYDKSRQTIVTVLYITDGQEIYHYIDIFGNKIHIKSELGYNKHWKLKDSKLIIPSEDIQVEKDGAWRIISEGILYDKLFKLVDNQLCEVI